jgi:hypothetical protein
MEQFNLFILITSAIIILYLLYANITTTFPNTEYIQGFARAKGVPKTAKSVTFIKGSIESVRRSCERNASCVGFSDRRYFVMAGDPIKRGTPIHMINGEKGEYAYIKDLYPTIFL